MGSCAVRCPHGTDIFPTQRLPIPCGPALVDQHHIPLAAMIVVTTALERLLQADGQTTIRQVIGNRATFREAVDQLDGYLQFRPEQFDRGQVNTQLREGKLS